MATPIGCVWEVLADSVVVTYSGEGSTPEQWNAYIKTMREAKDRGATRYLIYTDVVPPAHVLADIASIARGQPWQVSLISPSTAVRFAASTFAFVIKGFRFFTPDRIVDAVAHLGCQETEQKRALKVLARLRGEVDRAVL